MLAKRVKELREARCWSQAHLADAAALNVRTVQRIEAGEPCSYETAMALAAALGVDVGTFERAAVPQTGALASRRRIVAAAVCLAPLLLFVAVNLLRAEAAISAPYNVLAEAGALMSFRTFNLMSPVVFIGGGVVALLLAVTNVVSFRGKRDGRILSINAVDVRADWAAIIVALAAVCGLAILVGYAALEQLGSMIHRG